MARQPHRTHAATFTVKVAVAALRGDNTVAEIEQKFQVHPIRVTDPKVQLSDYCSEAFSEQADQTAAPNIENMEGKIGRLTLENDCLECALVKAGLLSAKR